MKKLPILVVLLISIISISIVSGTFALYTVTLDNLAEGSVVAKEFILLEDGEDTFEKDVKIAPGETVEWEFAIKNYDGTAISETAMDLDIKIDVKAADGKQAIEPLKVSVVNDSEQNVGEVTGVGLIEIDDEFVLAEEGQSHTYKVIIEWPSNDEIDANYAGNGFGTALSVTVTGTQK
ncbi:MAG TPA: hypothetical protein GXX17_08380 [Clostridiales bacterium]|nr:hypothetical protein [Clostridiales bacterium]